MRDDINAVKAAASDLISTLAANYGDLRIATVAYRDYPENPYGAPGDYVARATQPFTTDTGAARAGINAMSADGGNDREEAVLSAVITVMSGTGIGAWRPNAEHRIIVMGDSPGHDPEPFPGGHSFGDMVSVWNALSAKVAIHALAVGGYSDTEAQFASLAAVTGGSTAYADAANGVPAAIAAIIDDFTVAPNYPKGDVAAFKPVFTFTPPAGETGLKIAKLYLEIQTLAMNRSSAKWNKFVKVTLPPGSSSWMPTKSFLKGEYRWRTGMSTKTGTFTLPSGTTRKAKGATVMQADWTEVTRTDVAPGTPTQITPPSGFEGSTRSMKFQIGAATNADRYAVEMYKAGAMKAFKKLTVKLPVGKPNAEIIEFNVSGIKIGTIYTWRIQALNMDHPKPVSDAWIP